MPTLSVISKVIIVMIIVTLGGAILSVIIKVIQKKTMQQKNSLVQNNGGVIPTTLPNSSVSGDPEIEVTSIERFLYEFQKERPVRFTPQDLMNFTANYAERLGSGGFGVVYKGQFPNGVLVAVKVLNGTLDKRAEGQFMAEVGSMDSASMQH